MAEADIPDIPIKEAAASVIKFPILSSPFFIETKCYLTTYTFFHRHLRYRQGESYRFKCKLIQFNRKYIAQKSNILIFFVNFHYFLKMTPMSYQMTPMS